MAAHWKMAYEGILAESISFSGNDGDIVGGYMARPLGAGSHPGIIIIHEVFGLVEHTKELARKFAAHGYIAIAPDLYFREGPGDPETVAASTRQSGGIPDARVIGDLEGCVTMLRSIVTCNDKIGCIGHCSGGRHTLLFACNTGNLAGAVDCYGGRVVTNESTQKKICCKLSFRP